MNVSDIAQKLAGLGPAPATGPDPATQARRHGPVRATREPGSAPGGRLGAVRCPRREGGQRALRAPPKQARRAGSATPTPPRPPMRPRSPGTPVTQRVAHRQGQARSPPPCCSTSREGRARICQTKRAVYDFERPARLLPGARWASNSSTCPALPSRPRPAVARPRRRTSSPTPTSGPKQAQGLRPGAASDVGLTAGTTRRPLRTAPSGRWGPTPEPPPTRNTWASSARTSPQQKVPSNLRAASMYYWRDAKAACRR